MSSPNAHDKRHEVMGGVRRKTGYCGHVPICSTFGDDNPFNKIQKNRGQNRMTQDNVSLRKGMSSQTSYAMVARDVEAKARKEEEQQQLYSSGGSSSSVTRQQRNIDTPTSPQSHHGMSSSSSPAKGEGASSPSAAASAGTTTSIPRLPLTGSLLKKPQHGAGGDGADPTMETPRAPHLHEELFGCSPPRPKLISGFCGHRPHYAFAVGESVNAASREEWRDHAFDREKTYHHSLHRARPSEEKKDSGALWMCALPNTH